MNVCCICPAVSFSLSVCPSKSLHIRISDNPAAAASTTCTDCSYIYIWLSFCSLSLSLSESDRDEKILSSFGQKDVAQKIQSFFLLPSILLHILFHGEFGFFWPSKSSSTSHKKCESAGMMWDPDRWEERSGHITILAVCPSVRVEWQPKSIDKVLSDFCIRKLTRLACAWLPPACFFCLSPS